MSSTAAKPAVSVVIPTHNPRMDYLQRVLDALRGQTLPCEQWEVIVVDNGSRVPLKAAVGPRASGSESSTAQRDNRSAGPQDCRTPLPSHLSTFPPFTAQLDLSWHPNARIVREEKLGLTFARLRGFAEAKGELIVMVDDDNLLDPDYLANAVKIAEEHKDIGAFGGKCLPEFETQPEPWMEEFLPLLALRDHGEKEIIAGDTRSADGSRRVYPDQAAPIGAGMVLRSGAARAYAERLQARGERQEVGEEVRQESVGSSQVKGREDLMTITDRKGDSLASAGDNDLVFTILRDGWKVGYFPQLQVTHLIPSNRLTVDYLARANRGVQRSWVEVLRKHDACPWPVIATWSVPLRKLRASLNYRGWQRPEGFIRWRGACGQFEGREK